MARQNFVGLVVSQGKMQKTVKVRIETKVFNKRINKELFHRKDYLVHDEAEVVREGDLVRIEATRPLSKRKFFAVAEILKNKGQQFAQYQAQARTQVALEENEKTKQFLEKRSNREDGSSLLLRDVRMIQEALARGESAEDLTEIKARYGIQSFTPETLQQLLQLDVQKLEAQVLHQSNKIELAKKRTQALMDHSEHANEFLRKNGVPNPEALQNNIKKNMIRKYVLHELQ